MADERMKCFANDMSDVVSAINEANFFLIFKKPNKERITRVVNLLDYVSEEDEAEIERIYGEALGIYESHAEVRTKLLDYLKLNPEDVAGLEKEDLEELWQRSKGILVRHVEDCGECRRAYTQFLDEKNYGNLKDAQQRGEPYDKELKLKKIDAMYLGLMGFK